MNSLLLTTSNLQIDPLSPSGLSRNGKPAGCKHRGLYWRVKVAGKSIMVHNVIMMLHTGEPIPEGLEVDHIDRDGLNNKLENLRLVTRQENVCNTGCRKDSTTGVKGVAYRPERNKPFMAHIQRHGNRVCKSFLTLDEATDWLNTTHYGRT